MGRRRRIDLNNEVDQAHSAGGDRDERGRTPSRRVPSRNLPEPAEQDKVALGIKYLADYCGPRAVGSDGISLARDYIRRELTRIGCSVELQTFPVAASLYSRARLLTHSRHPILCLPVPGSPATSGTLRGVPRVVSLYGTPDRGAQVLPPNSLAHRYRTRN